MENFSSVKYAGAKSSAGGFFFFGARVLLSVGGCWFQSRRGSLQSVPHRLFLFGVDVATLLHSNNGASCERHRQKPDTVGKRSMKDEETVACAAPISGAIASFPLC